MTKGIDLSSLGLPCLPSKNSETISALFWAREVMQKHLTNTYAVTDPSGIEELKSIKIGGVNQWLHIRGRNKNNPILLYLHGGPGSPMLGFMDAIQRPWEDFFTIVQWDQRQTGKSYYPEDDESAPLTIEKIILDTEEVIQHLLKHLNQSKLFLLGHSWGSILGMQIVKRHAEWLYAYIGVGQIVNMMKGEKILYERLLAHAREKNQASLTSQLEKLAPYPDPECPGESFAKNCVFMRRELSRLAGETFMHHSSWDDAIKNMAFEQLISPHLTLSDICNSLIGDDVALIRAPYLFTEEFLAMDLPKEIGCDLEVPIFFFSGSHDWHTPITLSDQWFHEIQAPYKELIHFEESAHVIVNEEPGKILMALINKVLPFADNGIELAANDA